MIRAILHGCSGQMGQRVTDICRQDEEIQIVAGIDKNRIPLEDYPVFGRLESCDIDADVVIDFSNASAVDDLLDWCVEKKMSCVVCTTGLSEEQIKHVKAASEKIAILRSSNMTMGINLLTMLLREAVLPLVNAGFDIEIIEKHHNQKMDAPSGTAIALAEAMNEELGEDCEFIYDRSGKREKRGKNEIGISAVRGGTIVGDHDVIFAGMDEVITFSHRAYSKNVFAKGAVQAAKCIAGYCTGLFTMSDVIENVGI